MYKLVLIYVRFYNVWPGAFNENYTLKLIFVLHRHVLWKQISWMLDIKVIVLYLKKSPENVQIRQFWKSSYDGMRILNNNYKLISIKFIYIYLIKIIVYMQINIC